MEDISSVKFASVIARLLDDKKAKDIKILNISNISVLADYFVICSSDTGTHVRALTGHVREKIKEFFGRIPIGEENDARNRWNLLDYGDVIVHVLHKEERETYAIERFWNHALCMEESEWLENSKEYSEFEN
ncbi:MAG: ribosome silencing factor [Candidatus Gastranaerophilales bacterium]|nr:ribosome silencing factor [Candidatus Gastranaerophilales bacterium]